MQVLFFKFLTFSGVFLISIPGFSISRLANVEDFFNLNIFFKSKYLSINDYSFKYVCIVCYLKMSFYCFTCRIWFQLIHDTIKSSEILILKREMLLEASSKTRKSRKPQNSRKKQSNKVPALSTTTKIKK